MILSSKDRFNRYCCLWLNFFVSIVSHKSFIEEFENFQLISSETLLVEILWCTFDSFSDFQLNNIDVNKFDQSVAELWICHRICRIDVFVNLSDLCNFSSLVRLSETHLIDHQSLLYDCVYFHKTIVKRFWIC
jgi:hypothetical protein